MSNLIAICQGSREPEEFLEEGLFHSDKELADAIEQATLELEPIYIDRNIAIFSDYFLAAFYEEDLELVKD